MSNYTIITICLLSIMLASALMSSAECKDHSALRAAFKGSKHGGTIKQYWEDYYKDSEGGKKFQTGKPYYPTEPGIVFITAWLCTGEDQYKQAAVKQLDFAHSQENEDGILEAPEGLSRDTQARQIYNFYAAYKLLGDKKYLAWSDHCAKGMLDHLARKPHKVKGNDFTTFVALFSSAQKPYDSDKLQPWVDVNQNAECALAYTLLYHEPKSAFYKKSELVEVVKNEMEAGLVIVDPKTGAIPVAESEEWITKCDTAYGSYAMFSWVWLNGYWKNADWKKQIDRSGRWIAGFSSGTGEAAERFYPSHHNKLQFWDMWFRIPVLWQIKFKPDNLIDYCFANVPEKSSSADRAFTIIAYCELMAIPPEFYLPKQAK